MHDLDLISTSTIIEMRDRPKIANWSNRALEAWSWEVTQTVRLC